ncbi:MAG: helix-turn-helix transcriptional regulator [Alphaproteobacteria bacterium]|nr:helix-turn-helix transcriptional regulator [Alphaproteobacteria bacterium]
MRASALLAAVPSLADRRELFEAIKAEAKLQGLTLSGLAERAGIRQETLSRLPNRQDVGYDTLWRLANVLGFGIGLVPRDAARAGQPLLDPARFPGFKG